MSKHIHHIDKNILKDSLPALISVFCAFAFFVPTYDDYGSLFASMAASQFSSFSFIDLQYMGYIWVDRAYIFFYNYNSTYNWMGIGILLFSILGIYLTNKIVRNIFQEIQLPYALVFVIQLFVSLFLIENLVTLSHTRFSILLCGIALFNLSFSEKMTTSEKLFNSLLFVVGMLHRPESSIGMIALVSIGALLNKFNLKDYFKKVWLPLACAITLFSAFSIDWKYTNNFVRKIEPEIEYSFMAEDVVPLSAMKTPKDSIKYELAINGMWFDYKVMSANYLRSLLLVKPKLTYLKFADVVGHVLKFYVFFNFFVFFNLGLIVILFLYGNKKIGAIKIILFQLGVFAITFALDFKGHLVDNRHFLNIHTVALLISFFIFSESQFSPTRHFLLKRSILVLLIVLFVPTGYYLCKIKSKNTQMTEDVYCMESTMGAIEREYKNRTILLTLATGNIMNHNFSFLNKNYSKNKYFIYDMFTYSLIPSYMKYESRICNCDASNPVDFFKWMGQESILYLSVENRFSLTEKYLNTIYGLNMRFVSENDKLLKPACVSQHGYGDFELKRVIFSNTDMSKK